MSTPEWIVLGVTLAVLWIPVLVFIGGEIVAAWQRRQLRRRLRAEARPYRDLDLSHPIGRPRLGIQKTDRRRSHGPAHDQRR